MDSKVKKKNIIIYSSIIVGTLSLGTISGIFIKRAFSQTKIDYSEFDPESYKANSKLLLEQYNSNPQKEFTPDELVNIGLEKYRQFENSYFIGTGKASTIVEQTIRNALIKNGDNYFEESISRSSMVPIANRATQQGFNSGVNLYKGKAVSADEGDYQDVEKIEYNLDDYKKDWGKTINEMFIYIISDRTVISKNCSIKHRDDDLIQIELDLKPDIASYYYKIQMKSMSKLSGLPSFSSLKQTYIFDNEMVLKYSYVDEKYQASMGPISVNIHNMIHYYYHAGDFYKIPTLDEQIDYSLEGESNYEYEN